MATAAARRRCQSLTGLFEFSHALWRQCAAESCASPYPAEVVVVDTPPGLFDNKSSASRLVHGEKVQPSSSRAERNYPYYKYI